jgi:hypothetical protein
VNLRSRALFVSILTLLCALIALGGQALAQDTPSTVSFNGIGFSFDPTLGTSVNIASVPAQSSAQAQVGVAAPAHTAFAIYGARTETAKTPRIESGPVVRVYSVADMSGFAEYSNALSSLQNLLSQRPDLTTYMAPTTNSNNLSLPYLPAAQAGQPLRARAVYVDTPELQGVSYLTGFRQDVSAFAAKDFWYTFQGISTDGAWYVSVVTPVKASMFPKKVKAKDNNFKNADQYTTYLTDAISKLNTGDDSAFSPPLTAIDALVQSITLSGAPAAESPAPSTSSEPAPSTSGEPAPSAGESAAPS